MLVLLGGIQQESRPLSRVRTMRSQDPLMKKGKKSARALPKSNRQSNRRRRKMFCE